LRIPPSTGEDFNKHWGFADCKNKLILDIGGANGDTADYFLEKGARVVIAIDCSSELIQQCRRNSKEFNLPIVCICMRIDSSEKWIQILQMFQPEAVKVDCEGCEIYLKDVPSEIISLVPEFLIETHSDEIQNILENKFRSEGYENIVCFEIAPHVKVNHFVKSRC
jgi:predicted RNA methylase